MSAGSFPADIERDADSCLVHRADWMPSIAEALAAEHDIRLDETHWEIIHLLQRYYDEHDISPAMRALVSLVRRELGADKGNSLYLLKLFPGSPARIASKIAGLPRPEHCL